MTNILTTDDLLRAARENAEFREAFRREILTEELLKLPQLFAEYATATNDRLNRIEADIASMKDDIGDLKGMFTEHVAREDAMLTAVEMNLSLVHPLSRAEVMQMWQNAHHTGLTEDISIGNRRSFMRADLVMEAVEEDGTECYIAVEVSYVAHARDVERAKRNAQYLTRFTGKPAYAAVASVSLHDEVMDAITQSDPKPFAGQDDYRAFWSELEQPTRPN